VGWVNKAGSPKLYPDRAYWRTLKLFSPALGPKTDREFFDQLQFVADKVRYNVYLQVALIRIAAEDVELALKR
jgi:hypothetical protein